MLIAAFALVSMTAPFGPAAPSRPGGFDQTVLPADTRWVVHIDLGGIRASKLGSQLMAALEEGGHLDELDEVQQELGMNPLADVYSVTVHGVKGEEDAVAQIHMSAKADQIIEQLRSRVPVRALSIGDVQLLEMGDGEVFASVQSTGTDERRIVLASSAERVSSTVQVLRGNAPNMKADAHSAFSRGPSPGTWIFAACTAPLSEITDFEPASRAAELVRGGVFEFGEHQERIFASLEVDASSTEDARRLTQIVQGGLALLELALTDEEVPDAVRDVLGALSIEQLGEGVRLALRLPSQDLLQLLRELEEESGK